MYGYGLTLTKPYTVESVLRRPWNRFVCIVAREICDYGSDSSYQISVERPTSELEVTFLLIEGEIFDVNFTGGFEDCWRVPLDDPVLVHFRFRESGYHEFTIGTANSKQGKSVIYLLLTGCRGLGFHSYGIPHSLHFKFFAHRASFISSIFWCHCLDSTTVASF